MCFSDILTHLRSLNYALNVEIFTKKWFKIINNLYVNNRQIAKFWNCDILAFHRRNFLFFGFSNPDEHRLWGIKPLMSGPIRKGMLLLPARCGSGPFLPKFWTALATVIVGIFFRKKFWWGFRPISVAYQKEFWISWKKRRFQIFQKPSSPGFQSFLI